MSNLDLDELEKEINSPGSTGMVWKDVALDLIKGVREAKADAKQLRKGCQEDAAYLAVIDELVVSVDPEYPVTPYTLDCNPKGVYERVKAHINKLEDTLHEIVDRPGDADNWLVARNALAELEKKN